MNMRPPIVVFEGDDEQPLSLEEWYARRRAELDRARTRAHARLDEMFAEHSERLALQVELVERDMSGAAQH